MSAPRYGMIKNMPGARRILRIDGDSVHFEEEGVASRVAHRSRVTFLKEKKAKPKWEQGTLFKADAFGVSKVLKKEGKGYAIYSEKGKRLAKPQSLKAAKKRLQQIEYFKHKKA